MDTADKHKVLVTGASGFLGSRLVVYLRERGYDVAAYAHADLDISDRDACASAVADAVAVVNCAALADTGYCQAHEEESLRVNVEGAVNLALACRVSGARYVFISSDQVYNGTPLPGLLPEDAPLAPVNVYGRHKLLCEQRVLEVMPSAVGLRLTWMYDHLDTSFPKNTGILLNMRRAVESGVPIRANVNEYRGMTDVWEVVRGIAELLETPAAAGVYNFGSPNTLDSYRTMLGMAEAEGYPDPAAVVVPDSTRPGRNLSMDISRIRVEGIDFPDTVPGK